MKRFVEIDRGFATETRGIDGTPSEVAEFIRSQERLGSVLVVMDEQGHRMSMARALAECDESGE